MQHLALTITPVDFHADMENDVSEQGFINLWTRSLTDEDVDQMIEVWGVLPGEFMSAIFSMMTPTRNLTKYNLDLLDVADDERLVTPVVVAMLRSGRIRLAPAAPAARVRRRR